MLFTVSIILAAVGYGGACLYLYARQDRLLYVPSARVEGAPSDIGLAYEDVTLRAADGVTLHGWFVPHPRARAVVLFFHGNGGNVAHSLDMLEIFDRLGLSAFILDYHGYGRSGGTPSEQATYLDAQAAWDYLTRQRGIPPRQIVVFGRSLGAAVASWLLARERPAAAVIESGFTSLPNLAADRYPWLPAHRLSRYRYETLTNLRRAACPVLVAHSPDDEVVPFRHGRELFEAIPGEKAFLELRGDHNGGFRQVGDAYPRALGEFIARALDARPALQVSVT